MNWKHALNLCSNKFEGVKQVVNFYFAEDKIQWYVRKTI